MENRSALADELRRADAVVLTYACDQPATLDRLSTFWLPELRRLEVFLLLIIKFYIFPIGCLFLQNLFPGFRDKEMIFSSTINIEYPLNKWNIIEKFFLENLPRIYMSE